MTVSNPTVVLDTNVFLEVFSVHDLFEAYDAFPSTDALVSELNTEALVYRRARARWALLMAIRLHHERAVSYSLGEAYVQMCKLVNNDGQDPKGNITAMIVNFVAPRILSEWQCHWPTVDETPRKGNAADDAYVEYAQAHDLPLISWEGYRENGTIDETKRLRRWAAATGVAVLTPEQYYERSGCDAEADIAWFLSRFRLEAPDYIAESPNSEAVRDALVYTYGGYEHFLLGTTRLDGRPVSVTMPVDRSVRGEK